VVPERFLPVLRELAPLVDRFAEADFRLYLVGGTVRDLLLGGEAHGAHDSHDRDLDLTTDARPSDIKRLLEGWADAIWTQGERFGTIGAQRRLADGATRTYEITTFRAEAYTDESRKPHVEFADDIELDLSRRDFTVNAMALELTGGATPTLVDPHGGAVDLMQRVLRTPLGPEISFSDDPLRMLRAARFIARYELEPNEQLVAAVKQMAARLDIVSAERIRDELDKLMVVDHPAEGLWFLVDTGLAAEFLPELSPELAPGPLVRKRRDGTLTEPLAKGLLLQAGQPLPDALALEPRRPNRVVWLAALLPSEGERKIYARLDAKGAVAELSVDGKPTEIAAFDGRHVKLALRDGEAQVASHPLGTDTSGRDLFSRVLYGGQISLMVGLVATLVSLLIGVVYGAVSGFYGGKLDAFLMGVVDILYGIPYMFLVILLLVFFQRSLLMLFVALGAVQWLTMARIVRGQILSLKQKEFVEAARMSGTSDWGILFGHLIPNTLGVVVVYTTLTVPAVILQESFLAFIGLTVQYEGQSLDSWGALVKTGVDALGESGERSWLLLWPSFAMAVTLFSLNFLGDGLRDALDPQQRGRS